MNWIDAIDGTKINRDDVVAIIPGSTGDNTRMILSERAADVLGKTALETAGDIENQIFLSERMVIPSSGYVVIEPNADNTDYTVVDEVIAFLAVPECDVLVPVTVTHGTWTSSDLVLLSPGGLVILNAEASFPDAEDWLADLRSKAKAVA